MKSFYEYLSGVKKEYKYKVKLAVPVDEDVVDKLEKVLVRYDAIEISKAKKSILQHNEIDFPGIGPVESWTITVITDRPLVPQSLTNDIKAALNVSEHYIRVRGANEPVAVDERFMDEMSEVNAAAGDAEVPALLTFQEIPDPTTVAYGDDYNQSLLNYLAQIQSNRAAEMKKEVQPMMFAWLDDQTATEDAAFNAELPGVRPVSGSTLSAKPAKPVLDTAPTGNFDSRIKHSSKTVKSGAGLKKIEGKGK